MSKFHVGDRVRVADFPGTGISQWADRIGTVEKVVGSNATYPYIVRLDETDDFPESTSIFTEAELRPIDIQAYGFRGVVESYLDMVNKIEDDPVNHPSHYTSDPSGVECIEVTRHRNFNIGNAIKYLWRAGLKNLEGDARKAEIQDLKKAVWYIEDEIKRLEKEVE